MCVIIVETLSVFLMLVPPLTDIIPFATAFFFLCLYILISLLGILPSPLFRGIWSCNPVSLTLRRRREPTSILPRIIDPKENSPSLLGNTSFVGFFFFLNLHVRVNTCKET